MQRLRLRMNKRLVQRAMPRSRTSPKCVSSLATSTYFAKTLRSALQLEHQSSTNHMYIWSDIESDTLLTHEILFRNSACELGRERLLQLVHVRAQGKELLVTRCLLLSFRLYINAHTHTHVCVCHTRMCVCVYYSHMYVCMYIYVRARTHTHTHMCVCVCVCVCVLLLAVFSSRSVCVRGCPPPPSD